MTKNIQVRELNRLKEVFTEETYKDIDKCLYVTESSRVEVELVDFSTYTFRKLAEFVVDNMEGYGHRINRKKNNIIINSGVLQVLIADRLECLNQIKRAIEIFKAYKVSDTELTMSLVLNLIGRWWKEIPPEIKRTNSRKRAWYFYDNDDLIALLEDRLKVERKIYEQLIEAELKVEEYYKEQMAIKEKKELKLAKRIAKEMLKQQRKEVLERNRARRGKVGLVKV